MVIDIGNQGNVYDVDNLSIVALNMLRNNYWFLPLPYTSITQMKCININDQIPILRTTDILRRQMEGEDNFHRQHFSRVMQILTNLRSREEKYNSIYAVPICNHSFLSVKIYLWTFVKVGRIDEILAITRITDKRTAMWIVTGNIFLS